MMNKRFNITIQRVGSNPDEVIRSIVKDRIEAVLHRDSLEATNLDEVLEKYIRVERKE